ncbi:MAG TPA: TonB-dependent siderophore receptor [Gemmatimonadaceae bacterium]|nr:TonB-dependent siderophore receptor [Gemmatimonadaceae bacterium]
MRRSVFCALCCCAVAPCRAALAQSADSTAVPPLRIAAIPAVAADTVTRYRFDIPAQPLRAALAEFALRTGLRVEVSAEPGREALSSRVAGTLTAPEALRVLLAGTGYRARLVAPQLVVVGPAAASDSAARTLAPVVVTADATRRAGYAPRRTLSATKTDALLRDVPQAVTVLGRELIADQAMQGMADVVRYVPGITMGQGEGHRDAPTIRGNSSTADFFVDGVRDDAQYLRDLYNVERVEALKGGNAMIFGRGGGGGVINRVMKEAQWSPVRSLTLEGGSFDHRRATIDVGDGLGAGVAARVTGVYEDSRTFRDGASLERFGVNPTVALLAGGTLVRLGYERFQDDRTVDRGIPSFAGRPSHADITTFFGDPGASPSRVAVDAANLSLTRELPRGVGVRSTTRFVRYDKFYQNIFPGAVDSTETRVNLAAYSNTHDRSNLFHQTDLTYTFATGGVKQSWLLGAELGREVTDNFRRTGYFSDSATSISVPFGDPTVSAPVTFRQSATDADNRVTANVAAVYLQNQISLGAHWQAVIGARWERFALDFDNHRNGESLRRTDGMLSPRGGVIFKPAEPLSLYASYGVSYLPSAGDQFSSLTATTETLEPERFTNREVGLKWEPRPDLSLTAALYRLDRTNTSAPDPDVPGRVVQTGRQRTTGAELGVAGNLTSAWQIAGGWATQKARIVSRTSAAPEGATAPLVPRNTFSLWNRYQLAPRVGAGVGLIHQTRMYAAIDNSVTLPGFTRVDAAAFVTLSPTVRAQLNVENLLDRRYYPTSHGNNNIMPGASRTARVSLTVTP